MLPRKQKKNKIAESIKKETNEFIDYFKSRKKSGVKNCQCCCPFPKDDLSLLERKDKHSELPDIHQFTKQQVEELVWKCPRFTKQKLKKGAFYFEKAPTKDNVMKYTGINNVKTVLKYYGKGNPGYQIKDEDYSDQIKESLMSRLSFNCVFQRIRIPDGGSCCEWIGAALLLSMSETSDYMKDLNVLRKRLKLQAIRLSGNAHDVTQELRSLYAMSLTYDYQPNVHDFLGKYQEGL